MFWHKVRSGLMFSIAVIASPCCAPLIVPLILVLLAGTPIAAWLSYHIGWVYGSLTLVSITSLGLGLRWIQRNKLAKFTSPVLPSKSANKLSKVSTMN